MLYIVSTPIGNLKDITFRAVEVLKSVDLIACEDTRHTKILLDHYGIQTATTSFFQHNRFTKGQYLLGLLKAGKDIALVSDAGTPGLLDPGYNLINLAIENNIIVTGIPGACALVDALVVSGKPAHEFFFAGFLPTKTQARKNYLLRISRLKCSIVFYESCHRIEDTLKDIQTILAGKQVVVAREVTKKFEEIIRGSPENVLAHLKRQKLRGEFVVII